MMQAKVQVVVVSHHTLSNRDGEETHHSPTKTRQSILLAARASDLFLQVLA
jgi:hypothetical protein